MVDRNKIKRLFVSKTFWGGLGISILAGLVLWFGDNLMFDRIDLEKKVERLEKENTELKQSVGVTSVEELKRKQLTLDKERERLSLESKNLAQEREKFEQEKRDYYAQNDEQNKLRDIEEFNAKVKDKLHSYMSGIYQKYRIYNPERGVNSINNEVLFKSELEAYLIEFDQYLIDPRLNQTSKPSVTMAKLRAKFFLEAFDILKNDKWTYLSVTTENLIEKKSTRYREHISKARFGQIDKEIEGFLELATKSLNQYPDGIKILSMEATSLKLEYTALRFYSSNSPSEKTYLKEQITIIFEELGSDLEVLTLIDNIFLSPFYRDYKNINA